MWETHPWCHMTFWPRGHVRLLDKLKRKYLLFCKVFGHQTWDDRGLWWGKLTHDFTWPSDHLVAWDHVLNQKLNISYSTRPVTSKSNRALTYNKGTHPYVTWPSDHVVKWDHVISWKLNISSSTSPMITILCGIVTYDEGNSPIMSRDSLAISTSEVVWQTKKTSPLAQRLWPPNLGW